MFIMHAIYMFTFVFVQRVQSFVAERSRNILVYFRHGSAQTSLRAAILRQKL